MNRNLFGGLAFLLVLAAICAGVFWFVLHSREVSLLAGPPGFVNMRGDKAPQFGIATLDGSREVDPSSNRRPLVLEIFATWCEICQQEVPIINKVARLRGDAATVVAITGDGRGQHYGPETVADIRTFMKKYGVAYPVAFDRSTAIARAYHTTAFPQIIIIRRDGIVEYNMEGGMPYAGISKGIDDAIADEGKPLDKSIKQLISVP